MTDVKTFEEAVQFVIGKCRPEDRNELIRLLKNGEQVDHLAGMMHHGFGTYLRNELGLWREETNELRQDVWNSLPEEKRNFYRNWWKGKGDYEGPTMHADDASHTILAEAVRRLATA